MLVIRLIRKYISIFTDDLPKDNLAVSEYINKDAIIIIFNHGKER